MKITKLHVLGYQIDSSLYEYRILMKAKHVRTFFLCVKGLKWFSCCLMFLNLGIYVIFSPEQINLLFMTEYVDDWYRSSTRIKCLFGVSMLE